MSRSDSNSAGETTLRVVFRGQRSDAPPPEIAQAIANAPARLGAFSSSIVWFTEVTSTNDVAAMLAETGAAEGTVVAADAQTAGRGRLGRVWMSPPLAGLYVSLVLRPPAHVASLLTIAAGVAVSEGVEAATGLHTALKWPNDVHVSGRKIAGILAEAGTTALGGAHVVLGWGINLLPAAYPADVARRATSIEGELGRAVDRGAVLVECLGAFAAQYDRLRSHRHQEILAAWRRRASSALGRPVEWDANGSVHRGIAEDVDDRGSLLVRTDAGVARVISGEVRWI